MTRTMIWAVIRVMSSVRMLHTLTPSAQAVEKKACRRCEQQAARCERMTPAHRHAAAESEVAAESCVPITPSKDEQGGGFTADLVV
mmetsp:Transcript_61728/g.122028  ORF Transcript_61728/g.122028 Transcript_61728/m.122028 type:complete len:86 (+) Transcript_61728:958-1215(+)